MAGSIEALTAVASKFSSVRLRQVILESRKPTDVSSLEPSQPRPVALRLSLSWLLRLRPGRHPDPPVLPTSTGPRQTDGSLCLPAGRQHQTGQDLLQTGDFPVDAPCPTGGPCHLTCAFLCPAIAEHWCGVEGGFPTMLGAPRARRLACWIAFLPPPPPPPPPPPHCWYRDRLLS